MGEVTYTNDDTSTTTVTDAEMIGDEGYGYTVDDKVVEGQTFSRYLAVAAMAIRSAARAVAAAAAAGLSEDAAASSAEAAGTAAQTAADSRDAILGDAGLQAVAEDLLGSDHIGAVGAAIADVTACASNLAAILAAPAAASSAADDADRAVGAAASAEGMRYATAVGGTADAIALTHAGNPVTSYVAPIASYFVAAATNTGPVTISMDGLPAKAVVAGDGAALVAADITVDATVPVVYDPINDRFVISGGASKPKPGSNGYGSRTVSTSAPSGGVDGDIWYQV